MPPASRDRLRQLFRDRALIESARTLLGNRRQRCRQIALDQQIALAQRRAVGCGKISSPSRPARQPPVACPASVSAMSSAIGSRRAPARWPACSNSASVNLPEPYFSSASASPATVPGTPMPSAELRDFALSGLPSGPRKMSRVVARRRGLAIIDRDVLVTLGRMNHHEAAAADVAGARIGHRHREAGRDRRIDRIAATLAARRRRSAPRSFPAPPPCRVRRRRHERFERPAACSCRARSCAAAGRHEATTSRIAATFRRRSGRK